MMRDRLRSTHVTLAYRGQETALVRSGLVPGQRVVIAGLAATFVKASKSAFVSEATRQPVMRKAHDSPWPTRLDGRPWRCP